MQTAGRAARNANGRVILYGDRITPAMQGLIDQTEARRKRQQAYNEEHHVTPRTVVSEPKSTIAEIIGKSKKDHGRKKAPDLAGTTITDPGVVELDKLSLSGAELQALIGELTGEMLSAAESLEFERAAQLRDRIRSLSPKKEEK